MTKKDLYSQINDLQLKLYDERSLYVNTKNLLATTEKELKECHAVREKQSKEIKRLEAANKKQMQAIDALKKQLADKEIDRDRYAREVALKLAYAIAKSDNHISTHAKLNYQFITNTEPEPEVDSTLLFNDELKVTHIDEA